MGISVPVTVSTSGGSQMVAAAGGRIVYTSVIELSGAGTAGFELFDGAPATNRPLLDYSLNASGSTRDAWPEHGIPFEGDLWMGNTSGNARVIVHVVPEDHWHLWMREYWQELANLMQQMGGS